MAGCPGHGPRMEAAAALVWSAGERGSEAAAAAAVANDGEGSYGGGSGGDVGRAGAGSPGHVLRASAAVRISSRARGEGARGASW
jgi:hypothetical protein